MKDKKLFATRIDPEILKQLKHLSIDTDISISDLVEESLKYLLKKYKSTPPGKKK